MTPTPQTDQYRIVADDYCGYEVQTRKQITVGTWRKRLEWTEWKMAGANTHSSLEEAHRYIDEVLCTKVYETGTFPPRMALTQLPQQNTSGLKAKKGVRKNA